jgi:hypothetical protein
MVSLEQKRLRNVNHWPDIRNLGNPVYILEKAAIRVGNEGLDSPQQFHAPQSPEGSPVAGFELVDHASIGGSYNGRLT